MPNDLWIQWKHLLTRRRIDNRDSVVDIVVGGRAHHGVHVQVGVHVHQLALQTLLWLWLRGSPQIDFGIIDTDAGGFRVAADLAFQV